MGGGEDIALDIYDDGDQAHPHYVCTFAKL